MSCSFFLLTQHPKMAFLCTFKGGQRHPTVLPPAQFYCCFRPPEGRGVQIACGPESGTAIVKIPISFWYRAILSAGVSDPQLGPLSSSFKCRTILSKFRNCNNPGKVNLDFVKGGKTEWTPVLDSPPGPLNN
jgi:hypothetical protein